MATNNTNFTIIFNTCKKEQFSPKNGLKELYKKLKQQEYRVEMLVLFFFLVRFASLNLFL